MDKFDKVLGRFGLVRKSVFANALKALDVDLKAPLSAAAGKSAQLGSDVNDNQMKIAKLQQENARMESTKKALDAARAILS